MLQQPTRDLTLAKPSEKAMLANVSRSSANEGREGVRVCHIVSTFHPIIGGAQRATERICESLVRQGADIVILTRRTPGLPSVDLIRGVRLSRLGFPVAGKAGAFFFVLHALWRLATRLRGYQVVHVHNIDSPLLVGLVCRVMLGRALAVTIHGEVIEPKRRSALGRLRLHLMYRLVDVFAVLSTRIREQLAADGVQRSRVHIIPNAVDKNEFRPPDRVERENARKSLGISTSEAVAVFIGRLHRVKGVDVLLKAWATLSLEHECRLLVVGEGTDLKKLRELASNLSVAATVRFEGSTEHVLSYLHAADVFVLPSTEEGISIALLEAMAAGVTVVASAVPGNQAVVQDGHNGLLFHVNDITDLRDRLGLAFRSASLRQRLSCQARLTVERDFALGSVSAAHWNLYKDLGDGLARSHGRRGRTPIST